jgi:hypothetical protein
MIFSNTDHRIDDLVGLIAHRMRLPLLFIILF